MCSITVNITNNTGQGLITFNSFSFFSETGVAFSPGGAPYITSYAIQDNNTAVKALYAEGYKCNCESYGTPYYSSVSTSGEAVYNMPNGDTLLVMWDLDPNSSSNKTPSFTPSTGYYSYSGIDTPTITNGNDYVFNVIIS